MEFHITEEQRRLQERCRSLAADFASRAAQHDREASHPLENYAALCDAGLYALNVPTQLGGAGTFFGPFVGAATFLILADRLSLVIEAWPLVIGIVFMAFVLFLPRGIWGTLTARGIER